MATTRLGVGGQVQGLDAAAGAEVEGLADRLAQRELGQRRRGGADAEHVVGATRIGEPSRPGVRSLTTQRCDVVGGVRADVEQGADLAARRSHEARVLELVDQPGQGPLGVRDRDRGLEQEEPGERGERRPGPVS